MSNVKPIYPRHYMGQSPTDLIKRLNEAQSVYDAIRSILDSKLASGNHHCMAYGEALLQVSKALRPAREAVEHVEREMLIRQTHGIEQAALHVDLFAPFDGVKDEASEAWDNLITHMENE